MDEVARGGMGVIYKARQKDLNRIVALKVMLSGAMASDAERKRFLREAEACAALNHPNVIKVYEIGLLNSNYFFSMDFVEGVSLGEFVTREKATLTDRRKLEIMVKVFDAIHYGHEHGIVHRDLKPANIMINLQGEPIVMDFGLAKVVQSTDEEALSMLTATGAVMGTPHYMAPEQAAGKIHDIGPCTDIFALGVIMYELFTGTRPFTGNNVNEIFNAIFNLDPVSPLMVNPKLDWELEAIILKALEKEPEKRYTSVLDFKSDLERYLAGERITAKKISRWYYMKKKIRRHKAVAALAAAVCLLVAGGITWGIWAYVQRLDEIRFERGLEEQKLDGFNANNKELRDRFDEMILAADFNGARDQKGQIKNNLDKITNLVATTRWETRDNFNYQRLWELEVKEIEDTIVREEASAKLRAEMRLSASLTTEGDDLVAQAGVLLKKEDGGEAARGEAKRLIARAKRRYGDALVRYPGNENARVSKLAACFLMGAELMSDRDFGYSAEDNIEETRGAVKTHEEQKQLDEFLVRFEYEKNEMAEYEKYFKEGQGLFSQKDFAGALAKYESAQKYADTPEVQLELRKTRYRLECAKADGLADRADFWSAATAYRAALVFAVEDAEKTSAEQAARDVIEKGVADGIRRTREQIAERQLDEAGQTVGRIMAFADSAEVKGLEKLIGNLKAVPPSMIFIGGGEFEKGTPEKQVGNPVGRVTIDGFYMARYEVTNYQFKRFVDAGGYEKPAYWRPAMWTRIAECASVDGTPGPCFWVKGVYPEGADDLPVCGVSVYEAEAYARWLGEAEQRVYELPDELQWEKAASWDAARNLRVVYPWGDEWDVTAGSFGDEAVRIGAGERDRSPCGCNDMAGNLHEWVRPFGVSGGAGVIKGGAAKLPALLAAVMARAAHREVPLDGFRGERVGFRLVTYPLTANKEEE
ncbi:MAG: bifunctional serine/threonine-protein kinase/formylglycine-generating enzyme family protein [Planctomycetota bacterium]